MISLSEIFSRAFHIFFYFSLAVFTLDNPEIKYFNETILKDEKVTTKSTDYACSPKPLFKNYIYSIEENPDNYDYDDEEYGFENEEISQGENKIYRLPLFDSDASIVAHIHLPAKKFDIRAEVTVVCGEGTFLSVLGHKDYLWLGFMEGQTILQWNAGSGSLKLNGGKIRFDGRTRVTARRYRKDALLKVGSMSVKGTAPGRMTSLDTKPYIYIGSPPENITKLVIIYSILQHKL